MKIRIATRKSPLALAQTQLVVDALLKKHPDLSIEICPFITEGDRRLSESLARIGGKGLFLKELEKALLANEADLAIHSLKDVPAELSADFSILTVLPRGDTRDALIMREGQSLQDLASGAQVGTSSLRRSLQLKTLRPDLQFKELRGNANSRISKLDAGEYDAIILACAGLSRLQLSQRITHIFNPEEMLPSVGQGTLCAEFCSGNVRVQELLASIQCADTEICATAERAVTHTLQASCHAPVAAHAILEQDQLHLFAWVANHEGTQEIKAKLSATKNQALELGKSLAKELIRQGALDLLQIPFKN